MNIVKIRSPFIIEINEATQVSSKVEIYAWNDGDIEPTIPNYIMQKDIPSATQKACYFDVSIVLDEFINVYNAIKVDDITTENSDAWCFFKIKRYYNDGTWKLLDTISYVGVDGFSEYTDGLQTPIVTDVYLMTETFINNNYTLNSEYGYFNLLIKCPVSTYQIIYNSGEVVYNVPAGTKVYKIPYSNYLINQDDSCKIDIYNDVTNTIEYTLNSYPIEECKYTPVECSFINSKGGWQFLTFFKAQTNSISSKGSEYSLMPDKVNYDIHQGQSKMFNINGTQTIKLNTGWVDENYSTLMHDLLLSETILLDNKSVKLKTQSSELKNSLKDKMINYELDFEYAYSLINNVV